MSAFTDWRDQMTGQIASAIGVGTQAAPATPTANHRAPATPMDAVRESPLFIPSLVIGFIVLVYIVMKK